VTFPKVNVIGVSHSSMELHLVGRDCIELTRRARRGARWRKTEETRDELRQG
jgi:hypothetical protein